MQSIRSPKCRLLTCAALAILAATLSAAEKGYPITPIAELKGHGPVDFAKEVLPILRKNCLACHGHVKPKADLILENPPSIRKGGESGLAVVPGKGAESLLIKVSSGRDADSYMPPGKNNVGAVPLTPEQLGLIKLWIDQGALGDANAGVEKVVWRALPSGLNPILAVDVTGDGQTAACSRANQVYLYSLPLGQLSARLADPALTKDGLGNAADRDFVESLSFSPDGNLLASGGYRCVKIWRRQPPAELGNLNDPKAKPSQVKCVALHAPPHRAAKGMADGRVEIWDVDTAKLLLSFNAHSAAVNGLAFSADGALLISGSADGLIRIWNASDGALRGEIFSPVPVNAVAFHEETRQIVSAGAENSIRVWRMPLNFDYEALSVREIKGHGNAVNALEFINGGKQLLSGSADGSMIQWNFADGGQARKFDLGGTVSAFAARPDFKRFATAGAARAKVWNAENGQGQGEAKGDRIAYETKAAAERDAAFYKGEVDYNKTALQNAEKDQKAAVEALKKAVDAKAAAIKDAETKAEALKKATPEKDAAKKVADEMAAALKKAAEAKDAAVKAATDAAAEAKAAAEKSAALKKAFDKSAEAKATAEKALQELQAKANGADAAAKPTPDALKAAQSQFDAAKLAFERDMAMHAMAEKAAQEADAKSKSAAEARGAAEKAAADATAKNTDAANKFKAAERTFNEAFDANKNAMLARDVASQTNERAEATLKKLDGDLAQFKAALAENETLLKQSGEKVEAANKAAAASEKPLFAAACAPSGAFFAIAGEGGLVSFVSTENAKAGECLRTKIESISALKFLDDNRLLIAGNNGCIVWSVNAEWKLLRIIGTNSDDSPLAGRVMALQFSPDGKWLATGSGVPSRSGEVKLWNVNDGTLVREFKDAHSDTVFGLAFTSNGKLLASCSADRFIRVFDAASGKLVRTFEGHTDHVMSVSWKRDGRILASAGADKTVKFWDAITGEQKFNVENRFRKEVTSVHYMPGQNLILAAGADNSLKLLREDNGNDARNFGNDKGFIQSAAVTADGKTVLAGGDDSVLRAWDSNDGKLLGAFEAPK
ncbi:MAG TPA: c-type cytochrome domain-containing protein [Planctomycetota bacterium]|nr:c-type cytochrome domain-containing protein [Planctomycetota bacterium]